MQAPQASAGLTLQLIQHVFKKKKKFCLNPNKNLDLFSIINPDLKKKKKRKVAQIVTIKTNLTSCLLCCIGKLATPQFKATAVAASDYEHLPSEHNDQHEETNSPLTVPHHCCTALELLHH